MGNLTTSTPRRIHRLKNDYWHVGILPETGASIAFGRVKRGDEWVDVMRPTPESEFGNSSNCSSFIMLPWCNRIKNGVLRFGGQTYQLETTKDDGTARHGDVRKRAWTLNEVYETHIKMSLRSADFPDMNWPFKFSAVAAFRLEGQDFIWELALKNEDSQPFPSGFGHHPYFVKVDDARVQIPCSQYFELMNYMATEVAADVKPVLDFRIERGLGKAEMNDVLTGRTADSPAIIRYPQWGITLEMFSDPLFEHILLYAPAGKPYFAVEPMTNVSDGFNLLEDGVAGSGVFVLQAGEEKRGRVRLITGS